MPVCAAAPAFWVQDALLVRLIVPPLATAPVLSNRAVLLVMSKVAPESTVKVPLLAVVVCAASCSRVPVLTSTVAAAALVRETCEVVLVAALLLGAQGGVVGQGAAGESRRSRRWRGRRGSRVPSLVTLAPVSWTLALCPLGAVTVTVCPAGIVPFSTGVSMRVKEPAPLVSVSTPLL